MLEIAADPPPRCSPLLPGLAIEQLQGRGPGPVYLARDAGGRRFGAGPAGRPHDQAPQPERESAADSLQIAQTVKRDSIRDCDCAASQPRVKPRLGEEIAQRQLLSPPASISTRRSVSGSTCRRCRRPKIAGQLLAAVLTG
jgi:hypothetical protein